MNRELLIALLDSIADPIVFVDTQHIIRYVNKAAEKKYAGRGNKNLVGNSILKYHNESSQKKMLEIYKKFQDGEDEFLIVNKTNQKIFMRAVRDQDKNFLGYYERYEKIE